MNKELDLSQRQDVAPARTEPENMLALVARLAQDPTVDADKLERLMLMQEKFEQRQAKAEYTKAMWAMKPDLPVITKQGKIIILDKVDKTKVLQETDFARWEDIDEAITPTLHEHGFVLTFQTGVAADGKVTVTALLNHIGGHSGETTVSLPHDGSGSKNAVQAVGSTLSYGKRYAATTILNIRTKGEDDDGHEGGNADVTLLPAEIAELTGMIEKDGGDIEKFCKFMKTDSVAAIMRKDIGKAREAINSAREARAKKAAAK